MAKTYSQIQEQIAVLQREADTAKHKEVAEVIVRIKEAISTYGLTARELGLTGKSAPQTAKRPAEAKRKSLKKGRAAKYRDGDGNVWVGRGPRPKWLRDALTSGKALEDFRV